MQIPLFEPKTLWKPPAHLPKLGDVIAIDLETNDPNIKVAGPGYKRNDGQVVGIALADEHQSFYLPFKHIGGDNLSSKVVIEYTKQCVLNSKQIIMANATYDLGWLETLGVKVSCPVRDIQVAEALIDEERYSYGLNALATKYLKKKKEEKHLTKAAQAYDLNAKQDMWKLPARHVGKYAEKDARYTYDIYQQQIPKLKEQDLWQVW